MKSTTVLAAPFPSPIVYSLGYFTVGVALES